MPELLKPHDEYFTVKVRTLPGYLVVPTKLKIKPCVYFHRGDVLHLIEISMNVIGREMFKAAYTTPEGELSFAWIEKTVKYGNRKT